MDDFSAELHGAVAAVCPIFGVAIVELNDKSTWRIDFQPIATTAQKVQAQDVLNAFVPSPPKPPAPTTTELLARVTKLETDVADLKAKLPK